MQTWIRTSTGKQFFPLAPTPDMVDIEDIAHALSHQCRFSGHTENFYSVGQHSLHVADLIAERYQTPSMELAALLHDASEAYLVDLPTPLKRQMPTYRDAEHDVMGAIMQRFGLKAFDDEIKCADLDMLVTEARDLMGGVDGWINVEGRNPMPQTIIPMRPFEVKREFLRRFMVLTNLVQKERFHEL